MTENIPRKHFSWQELDVLRGIAVIMMLINHAAVNWLSSSDNIEGVSGFLSFIGSFAPVIFFFITGFGYGVSHCTGRKGFDRNVFFKALILILMDGVMRLSIPLFEGWDFLAFIGLSMLLLQILRGRKNAILLAVSVSIFLILLRFLGVYIYKTVVLDLTQKTWLSITLGIHAAPGISYWFVPWFVYPLAGFIIGVMFTSFNIFIQRFRLLVIIVLIVLGAVVGMFSIYLNKLGAIYFRWGTMSINYFLLSFSIVALSLGFSFVLCIFTRADKIREAISMRGISSLSVVPVHYFFINIAVSFSFEEIKPVLFYFLLPFWLFICMILSKSLNRYLKMLSIRLTPPQGWYFLPVLIFFTILLSFQLSPVVMEILKLSVQLILCFLLSCSVFIFQIGKNKNIEKL